MDFETFGLVGVFGAVVGIVAKLFDRMVPSKTDEGLKLLCEHVRDIRKMGLERTVGKIDRLFDCHLGDGAHDDNGRLKWWFPQDVFITLKSIESLLQEGVEEIKKVQSR